MNFQDILSSAKKNLISILFSILVAASSSFLIDIDKLLMQMGLDVQNIPAPIDDHWTRQLLFVCFVIAFIIVPLLKILPRLGRYFSFLFIKFLVTGFRCWADDIQHSTNADRADELWKWITDQVFVAQRQYAFAMGCIVFKADLDGLATDTEIPLEKIKTLLRLRPLGEWRQVALWPGSRVRGVFNDDVNIPEFVKKIVSQQTGINIGLTAQESDETPLLSAALSPGGQEIENHLHPAPFLIMRQNRPQKNGVPGHVELLYVGEYQSGQLQDEQDQWVTCSQMSDLGALWPDTHETIKRAADWYRLEYLPRQRIRG